MDEQAVTQTIHELERKLGELERTLKALGSSAPAETPGAAAAPPPALTVRPPRDSAASPAPPPRRAPRRRHSRWACSVQRLRDLLSCSASASAWSVPRAI